MTHDVNAPTAHGRSGCALPFAQQASIAHRVTRIPAPILIIDGDKGGVGKSFTARIIAYLLSLAGKDWDGFDVDGSNGHLARFHKDRQVGRINWIEQTSWNDGYIGLMEVEPSKAIIIDLPSQIRLVTPVEFPRLLATAQFLGRPVLRFWTMAPRYDSVNLLRLTMDLLPPENSFAVKNLWGTTSNQFDLWRKSKTRVEFLRQGGTELELPELAAAVETFLNEQPVAFADAHKHLALPFLIYDLEHYLTSIRQEFSPVLERLV